MEIRYIVVLSWKIIRNIEEAICEGTFQTSLLRQVRNQRVQSKNRTTPRHSTFQVLIFVTHVLPVKVSYNPSMTRDHKSNNLLFCHLIALKTLEMALLQIWWAYAGWQQNHSISDQQSLVIGSDHMKTSRNQVLVLNPLGETLSSVLYNIKQHNQYAKCQSQCCKHSLK